MKRILCLGIFACMVMACVSAAPDFVWVGTGDRYAKDGKFENIKEKAPFGVPAWRGEKISAQAYIRSHEHLRIVSMEVSDLVCGTSVIPCEAASASFVEYVMGDVLDSTSYSQCGVRAPGQYDSLSVADMIDNADVKDIVQGELQPVWISVRVPSDAVPGVYSGNLKIKYAGGKLSVPFTVEVCDRTLPAPSDWKFHLDLWQNPYSVARYHGVELWSQEHFDLMRPVMKLLADAGQKSVTATILDRPWNGQTYDAFGPMVTKTKNADGSWTYDYTVFDRWVEFMESVGIDRQINCYSLIPWALRFDYIDGETGEKAYVEAAPGSVAYKAYWAPFISDFAGHLRDKGWFGKTMIAMDERPLEAMTAALDVIRSVEPEFKVSLAGNYHEEIEKELHDLCIPFRASYPEGVIGRRRSEGKVTTYYTCCAEAYPNTFMASSPYEAAWIPWRAIAADCDGYLRWAYNSWTDDPVRDARFRTWAAGDCYMVYPDGRSSIRMENLIDGIQDVEKIRILAEEWMAAGDEAKLKELEDVLSLFTYEELRDNGAEPAIAEAKAFLCR